MTLLRKLYDWVFSLARSRHATPALAVVSFAESSIFPIPPDVMLAPMILARPEKAYFYAFVCTVASVLGGILGYAIGYYLTDLGLWLMSLLGHSDGLEEFQHWFDRWGLAVILIKGLTPVPYKLVTIASGLAAFSFPVFVAASVATRGGRFFLEAWILKRWGPAMLAQVEKRLAMWSIIGIVVLVGAVVAVKVLF
ncbi:DedA family protein [Roseibacterium beibuensis]|uniref:YqaA family protein n=1 Tax=[Roseibacterium] beibuensis TaxID=1193142 RepID=UPI00217E5EE5|nr:YqaA family protein [Roseibacterium beibuensis]MCS6626979.1 DedA family protein [Roseibacterium beibuensis]